VRIVSKVEKRLLEQLRELGAQIDQLEDDHAAQQAAGINGRYLFERVRELRRQRRRLVAELLDYGAGPGFDRTRGTPDPRLSLPTSQDRQVSVR
jgi:hypothetical protein